MTEVMTFSAAEVMPGRVAVFENQGIPEGKVVQQKIDELYTTAMEVFAKTAVPVGMLLPISEPDFRRIHHGEGRNEPRTPVGDVFGRADHLALFAVTLGQPISQEIDDRFGSNDFALACMLDSVASAAADTLTRTIVRHYVVLLSRRGHKTDGIGALAYSPGYCGWDISGQRRLFQFLRPEQIGISLRESLLMQPLKSVSGVVIAGPREIHSFADSYPFCGQCETRGCRERIRKLLAE